MIPEQYHVICCSMFFVFKILEYADGHPFPHFQFVGWPDHGAPKSTDSIIALVKEVRKIVSETEQNVKVLVHCNRAC